MKNGRYARIVAEALNETGRTISDFRFSNGDLTQAHVIRVGYKGYPDVNLAKVPPHDHLVIDPTDVILSDETYNYASGNYTSGAVPCGSSECDSARKEARTEASLYVRLMNTPSPGLAEDESYWDCTPAGDAACPIFKREEH